MPRPGQADSRRRLSLDKKSSAFGEADSGEFPIVAGDAEASEIVQRIFADSDEVMPPKDSDHSLTKSEKSTLKEWIEQGATWEEHWAFQRPVKSSLPKLNDASWATNEIDYFVLSKMNANGLTPNRLASKEALISQVVIRLNRPATKCCGS